MTNIRCGGTTFHLSYCQHLKVSHASFVKWAISTKDAKYKWTKETTYPSEVTYMFNIFKSSSILCLTEIFIMETIFVLQCQDVTQHVSINYYQVLFLVLRNITRLKSRHQFMLKIETTHLKRALSMPIMQMVDVFVFMLVLCVVLGSSHSQRQIH